MYIHIHVPLCPYGYGSHVILSEGKVTLPHLQELTHSCTCKCAQQQKLTRLAHPFGVVVMIGQVCHCIPFA